MKVEALVTERTFAATLVEVLAVLGTQGAFVISDQLFLLLLRVHPIHAGTDEIRGDTALRARSYDLVVELLRLAPFSDAGQAEAVIAIRQYAEPLFPRRLLHYCLETDAAGLLLATLNGERQLHVRLVLLHACIRMFLPQFFIVRM